MALLGKIRSKGVLLMVVVGVALFAFVIGDAFSHGGSFFNKSQETVAEILGENININDYSASIDQMVEVYKIETGQNDLSEEIIEQLRTSVWESLLNEKILYAEAEKLGLSVSTEELSDYLIGDNTHPIIMQRRSFANENGQFDRQALVQFLNSLDQEPTNEQMAQEIKRAKNYWLFWERNVKMAVLQEKYNALISKTVTANSLDAKMSYEAGKFNMDVNYVVQPYFTIPDTDVKVENNEIKDRYNKQKEQYKQEATRSLAYVVFNIKPSDEDYKEAKVWMDKLAPEFATTEDVAAVVNSNSDIMYDGRNYSEQNVPVSLKPFAFSSPTGAVFGPVFQNDTYTMARVMETGINQADSAKLRHIYLVDTAQVKVDSLVNAIKAGANFGELALKHSAVQQTAANGGEIGWITVNDRGIDKETLDNAFGKAINEVFVVKNAQGTQIMQVMERTPARPKVKLAILERKVIASSRTYSKIFNEAKQFAAELKADNFEKKAEEKTLTVRFANETQATAPRIAEIPQSRQIIRWAFENDKNVVSDVFDCGTQYVVAMNKEVGEKGYAPLTKVQEQIRAEIIRDKKADILIKKMSGKSSLVALAGELQSEVKTAEAVNFSSFQFGGAGFEPALIGKATTLEMNKLSAPVKGNSGVYVLQVVNKADNGMPFDVAMSKMQLNSRTSYTLPYTVLQNLRDKAEITDNRIKFF